MFDVLVTNANRKVEEGERKEEKSGRVYVAQKAKAAFENTRSCLIPAFIFLSLLFCLAFTFIFNMPSKVVISAILQH